LRIAMGTSQSLQEDMRPRIPLYIAGLGVSFVGIIALGIIMGDSTVALLMSALTAVGFATSWRVRAGTLRKYSLQILSLILLVSVLVANFVMPAFRYVLLPARVYGSADLALACMLVWLMVIHSFTLVTDKAVLFMCVPSLSLISLAATLGRGVEMLIYFVVLLVLACFVLIQQNALSDSRPSAGRGESLRFHPEGVRRQAGLALGVTLTAIAVGIAFSELAYPHFDRIMSSRLLAHGAPRVIQQFGDEDFVPVAAGPVSLGEEQVMMVRCDRPLLWRSQTFNRFTGRGWLNGPEREEELLIHAVESDAQHGFAVPLPLSPSYRPNTFEVLRKPAEMPRAVECVDQVFFHIVVGRSNIVFGAAEPKTVRLAAQGPLLGSGGGLRLNEYYGWGMSYEVQSLVSSATPEQLRAAPDNYPPSVREAYLDVPQSCWPVERLVREITAGRTNAYDRAVAIQRYLQANYRYDANAPAVPGNEDVVCHFLLKSRRGYCDVSASAMVIMCRFVGIPARWVTGFDTGEFDPAEKAFRVRAKDSHAWAEVYFPGHGWIAFDPTPSAQNTGLAFRICRFWAGVNRALRAHRPSMVVGGLILLLVLYLLEAELAARIRTRRRSAMKPAALGAGVAEYYHRMCALLSRFGYPRSPVSTPLEYAAELEGVFGSSLGHLSAIVRSLTASFVECRYSGREPSSDATTRVAGEAETLLRYLKAAKKQKLLPQ